MARLSLHRNIPMAFYESLALLLSQHLPLRDVITTLLHISPKDKALVRLQLLLKNGLSFSQALVNVYPHIDSYEHHLLSMGERTQQLSQCLNQLITHRKQLRNNRAQLSQACFYPCLTLAFTITLAYALITTVLPTCLSMYQQQNMPLPPLTQTLLNASTILTYRAPWFLLWLLLLNTGIILLKKCSLYSRTISHHRWHIPGIYHWLNHRRYSRLCHMLHLSLAQHTPLHKALTQAAKSLSHIPTQHQLNQLAYHLNQGHPLSIALKLTPKIPPLMRSWLTISANQHQLAKSMKHLSQIFNNLAEKQSQKVLQWLNPLLLCLVSGFIGTIICAIYLPIFQLGQIF